MAQKRTRNRIHDAMKRPSHPMFVLRDANWKPPVLYRPVTPPLGPFGLGLPPPSRGLFLAGTGIGGVLYCMVTVFPLFQERKRVDMETARQSPHHISECCVAVDRVLDLLSVGVS